MDLPAAVPDTFEIYVNGIPQRRGLDYEVEGRSLVFERSLAQEGRLGFWRWLSIIMGVAGTYRQNDSIDVVYDAGGRRAVITGLEPVLEDR